MRSQFFRGKGIFYHRFLSLKLNACDMTMDMMNINVLVVIHVRFINLAPVLL